LIFVNIRLLSEPYCRKNTIIASDVKKSAKLFSEARPLQICLFQQNSMPMMPYYNSIGRFILEGLIQWCPSEAPVTIQFSSFLHI